MTNMLKLAVVCLFLTACDNGAGGMVGPMPDAPPGTPVCTGVTYDWCASADECASHNCHFFEKQNFTICTQTCGDDNPCPPDRDGNATTCNNRGMCKPAIPNLCVLD